MIQDYIPPNLIARIASHLRRRCNQSISKTWKRNKFDEDSITSSFFESLAIENQIFIGNGSTFHWSIEYSATSSKGLNSLEKLIGADVIFFIEIKLGHKKVFRKGILVQSKIRSHISREKLESQISEMERFVPNSSIVLAYANDRYSSCTGRVYLSKRNQNWDIYSIPFCDFLADSFMTCTYGIEGLYYDYSNDRIIYMGATNQRIVAQRATRISIIDVGNLNKLNSNI